MSGDPLTRDNLHLSRPSMEDGRTVVGPCEINFTPPLPLTVTDCVRQSLSDNTRRAYLTDLEHFERWGGQIPAAPEVIASYLVSQTATISVATLNRRIAALSKVHRSRG